MSDEKPLKENEEIEDELNQSESLSKLESNLESISLSSNKLNGNVDGEKDDRHTRALVEAASLGIDLTVMHPLENEWTFWYDRRPQNQKRSKSEQEHYESNLRPVGSFAYVEDFWRYYNHMVKPSKMEINANYHLFKAGLKPMWEDPGNKNGGKWIITLKDKNVLDQSWENLVLAIIGETLHSNSSTEICGLVVSRRKHGDRIALWNKNKDDEATIMELGYRMKALIGLDKIPLNYQSHDDAMRTGASYSNPDRYTL